MPGLSSHLMSLRMIAEDAGNCYARASKGITIKISESRDELFSPSIGQLNGLYRYRTGQPNEQGHVVIAPRGPSQAPKPLT